MTFPECKELPLKGFSVKLTLGRDFLLYWKILMIKKFKIQGRGIMLSRRKDAQFGYAF
jgi:hypothetical protein